MTAIEWTDVTWNPVRGCTKVSPGCAHCYAETFAERFRGVPGHPYEQGFDLRLVPEKLTEPLHWRKPRRVFVNSMSDLFHEDVPDEFIDQVFAVMALAPQHTFQVLTKRAERMRDYLSGPEVPGRVMRAADALDVQRQVKAMGDEQRRAVDGFPGYYVSDRGHVYLEGGSETCVRCGSRIPDAALATRKYCASKCRQADAYDLKTGRLPNRPTTYRRLRPQAGESGHLRVQLTAASGETVRRLVHRLVLSAFSREPAQSEETCHRDEDPSNNALLNLRWGTRVQNRDDRRRHGRARSWSKLTFEEVEVIRHRLSCGHPAEQIGRSFNVSGTQIRNIGRGDQWATTGDLPWPLPQAWVGVSVENQATADERIPLLRQIPAAVRFLSCEPLLGPVALRVYLRQFLPDGFIPALASGPYDQDTLSPKVDWVIVGGESGPKARPCDVSWIRSIRYQCRAAEVPLFIKQLGSCALDPENGLAGALLKVPEDAAGLVSRRLKDRKGGDISEFPEDLRVREFPA